MELGDDKRAKRLVRITGAAPVKSCYRVRHRTNIRSCKVLDHNPVTTGWPEDLVFILKCCHLQVKTLNPGTRVKQKVLRILVCTSGYHQNDRIKAEAQQIHLSFISCQCISLKSLASRTCLGLDIASHSEPSDLVPHGRSSSVHTEQLHCSKGFSS